MGGCRRRGRGGGACLARKCVRQALVAAGLAADHMSSHFVLQGTVGWGREEATGKGGGYQKGKAGNGLSCIRFWKESDPFLGFWKESEVAQLGEGAPEGCGWAAAGLQLGWTGLGWAGLGWASVRCITLLHLLARPCGQHFTATCGQHSEPPGRRGRPGAAPTCRHEQDAGHAAAGDGHYLARAQAAAAAVVDRRG